MPFPRRLVGRRTVLIAGASTLAVVLVPRPAPAAAAPGPPGRRRRPLVGLL